MTRAGLERIGWLLAAAAAAACAFPVPAPVAVAALAPTLAWTPGALAAVRFAPRWSGQGRALLALTLAPALSGGAVAALMAAGAHPVPAARITAGAIAALALAAAWVAGPRPAPREPLAAPLAASLWTALCAALLLGNPFLPRRSDGWFHAAVTREIAQRGVPPEDPFFAGLRLLYFWGEHAWAAAWMALAPALAPWVPLIALNLTAAFACLLGVCLLARRLGATPRGEWLAAAIAVAGYAPFAWGAVAARAAAGEVRGLDEVRRLVGQGADPALQNLSPGLLHASMAFFGDKFLVLTPFAIGLALFTAFLLALLDLAEPGERPLLGAAVALGLLTAAALFLHTVVGYACAALTLTWAVSRIARAGGDGETRRRVLAGSLAIGLALVLTTPYLIAITHGKRAAMSLEPGRGAALTLVWAGALLVPAGVLWLARAASGRIAGAPRPATRTFLGLGGLLAGAALLLRLPESNQSKFFNLLFLLMSAPAALGWLALDRRLRGVARMALWAGLALAAVPTTLLCLWGYTSERGTGSESLPRATAAEAEATAWAGTHLAASTVLVDALGIQDLPVETGRSLLWGGAVRPRDWGYPPGALELRRRASRELGEGIPPSPAVRELIRSLGRDVVVVDRARDPLAAAEDGAHRGRGPLERDPGYALLWRNDAITFYRWEGAR